MADDADADAARQSSEPVLTPADARGPGSPNSVTAAALRGAGSRPWLGRTLWLGLAFLMPCLVIALSVYFIVRGGPRVEAPAPSESAASSAAAPALNQAPAAASVEAEANSAPSSGNAPVVAPGFEDEGNDEEPSQTKRSAPKHFATVQDAAAGSCSTESVDGLSRQIIEQARCIKPNDFASLPKRPNLLMAAHVFPYLELSARDHLVRALDAHTAQTMTVNSALRTVAQQYLVSRWGASKACGVQLATQPGDSNHEIGTALDIAEAAKWRPALEAEEFRWLGTSDRVHFDYKGSAAPHHSTTDVLAFQKLWNKNHPTDVITESGHYDPSTEQRLKKAPPGGFAIGASCGRAVSRKH